MAGKKSAKRSDATESSLDGSGITECTQCLKSALASSPKVVLWSAFNKSASSVKTHSQSCRGSTYLGTAVHTLLGLSLLTVGTISIVWSPYQYLVNDRLEMRRGLPPYEWWADPPETVFMVVHVFNVTNAHEYVTGKHSKIKMQDVGPIYYKEKMIHSDVVVNGNGTMSYTATRVPIYLPDMNTIDLNATITVPNLAILGLASFMWNTSFPMRIGLNLLFARHGYKAFKTMTIYDYMWNFRDPVIDAAQNLMPHLVPTDNFGILHQIYSDYVDRVTVLIGKENGDRRFFMIDKYNGRPGLGRWKNETCDSVQGSSDGILYHQSVSRSDTIYYLRKSFCRKARLLYVEDRVEQSLDVMRFDLTNDTHDRPSDGEDCYLQDGLPPLPSGLTDGSPCFYNFPVAFSFPHFFVGDPVITEKIDGMQPDYDQHGSYLYLEPHVGIPVKAAAKVQVNLVVRPIKVGFGNLKRFFNMTIPMFWVSYEANELPGYISALLYFLVVILRQYEMYLSITLLLLSSLFLYLAYHKTRTGRLKRRRRRADYSSLLVSTPSAE